MCTLISPAMKLSNFFLKLLRKPINDEEEDIDDIEKLLSSEEEGSSGDEMLDEQSDKRISTSTTDRLINTWKQLSPPTDESTITGRWYAGVYKTKQTRKLCIGWLLWRFLVDEDGENGV